MKEELIDKSGKATTSTHYWGYRELTAAELQAVGGGDDGDGGGDMGGDRSDGATTSDYDFGVEGVTADAVDATSVSPTDSDYNNNWGFNL